MNPTGPAPHLSVVIPVFNEARVIEPLILGLNDDLDAIGGTFEIILSENGSTDSSHQIADALASSCDRVRVLHLARADYGFALKQGLTAARGDFIFHCSADLVDLGFLRSALALIEGGDAVLGSKYLQPGTDARPWFRRALGRAFAGMLRLVFRLPVADTHGIKLFRREAVAPHIDVCRFGGAMFDTELILNLSRAGLRLIEIPFTSSEIRPSRKSPFAVACRALWDLVRLLALRF
jgi:glycosyltransferase involved in cell wall biosynthesis